MIEGIEDPALEHAWSLMREREALQGADVIRRRAAGPPGEPTLSSSHWVSHGYDGRIQSIDGKLVSHDPVTGRINRAGGKLVRYDSVTGRMSSVGGKLVRHDPWGNARLPRY